MMKKWEKMMVGVLFLAVVGCAGESPKETARIERFLADEGTGLPSSVRVKGGALVHTTQLFPRTVPGEKEKVSMPGQLDLLLSELDSILKEHGSDVERVAKLNLYVSDPGDCVEVRKLVGNWYEKRAKPTITVISTPLPRPGTKIALDAVAVVADSENPKGVEVWSDLAALKSRTFGGEALAAVAGRETDLVYISGRASKVDDLRIGTKQTMEQLMSVLLMLGGQPENVVQVKAFLNPMTEAAFAAEAIQDFFEKMDRPPVVMVEWTSSSYPTEIEMIAAIPEKGAKKEKIMYMTPPGDKPSPVYSKVAVVRGDEVVYVGGVTGGGKLSPEGEVTQLFDRLNEAINAAGSNFQHLVKATYYVSDPEVSKELNNFRPKVYNPEKPPAASKVSLEDIGAPGRGMLIDMIAVPGGSD